MKNWQSIIKDLKNERKNSMKTIKGILATFIFYLAVCVIASLLITARLNAQGIVQETNPFDISMNGQFEKGDRIQTFTILTIASGIIMQQGYENWHLSTGFDVKNAIWGGTVNPATYDGIYRLYWQKKRVTLGFMYEYFDYVKYDAISMYLGWNENIYDICQLTAGFEVLSIYNQNQNVFSQGIFAELKSPEIKGLSCSLLGRYTNRPELSQPTCLFNGYFTVNYSLPYLKPLKQKFNY